MVVRLASCAGVGVLVLWITRCRTWGAIWRAQGGGELGVWGGRRGRGGVQVPGCLGLGVSWGGGLWGSDWGGGVPYKKAVWVAFGVGGVGEGWSGDLVL